MEQSIQTLLNVKIEHKESIHMVGKSLRTSFQDGRQATEIPPFFHETVSNGDLSEVPGRKGTDQFCVVKLNEGSQEFDYIIAVEADKDTVQSDDMVCLDIPPQDYAVLTFIKRGNPEVLAAFQYIEKSWLPQSGYKPSGGPGFIYYRQPFFDIYQKYGYDGDPVASVFFAIEEY